MGLRKQILLLALVTLVLPWAGWEIVREMERVLRQSQVSSLKTIAHAAATHFHQAAADLPLYGQVVPPKVKSLQPPHYFAHSIDTQLTLDGYAEDWVELGLLDEEQVAATSYSDDSLSVSFAQQGESLFVLVQVNDSRRQFYSPVLGLDNSDHLRLDLDASLSGYSSLKIFSAAVGGVSVQGVSPSGALHTVHQVAGFWNEGSNSYTIEFKLPMAWVKGGIRFRSVDGELAIGARESPNLDLLPILIPSDELDAQLAVFAQRGLKLYLVYRQGWVVAEAGDINTRRPKRGINLWMEKLLRVLVGEQDYPLREDLPAGGRLLGAEFESAQLNNGAQSWFKRNGKSVARVVVPIGDGGRSPWLLAVDQSSESIESLANGVMGRLIFYFLIALALVLAVLLAYASLLSYRIRQLRAKTQSCVDPDGRISGSFDGDGFADEIGDLSRSYASLLERLRAYNKYLETLSGKLSHELRTPLAIVSTSLDNLSQQELTSECSTYLSRANEGAARLSSILRAMAEASRIEQTIHREEKEHADLVAFIRVVVASYRDAYTKISLSLNVPKVPVQVEFAPELMLQLLDKLMDNAAEFAGEGGKVNVSLEDKPSYLSLSVANNGPLLKESSLTNIFDSMVSERGGKKPSGNVHLGLGLYIVRLIAEFHNAEIKAYNDRDESLVVFELRFAKAVKV